MMSASFTDGLERAHSKAFGIAAADIGVACLAYEKINACLQNGDGFAVFRGQLSQMKETHEPV